MPKDSTIFKAFAILFCSMACIAFWLWVFDTCWALGLITLGFCVLAIVAICYFSHAKKFNL